MLHVFAFSLVLGRSILTIRYFNSFGFFDTGLKRTNTYRKFQLVRIPQFYTCTDPVKRICTGRTFICISSWQLIRPCRINTKANYESNYLFFTKFDKNMTSCNKFVNKVVFALLVPSCQQVWNKLLTTCNNLVDIIRFVARLFQQVRYSHDITILLQPCVVNLVTFMFIMTVSDC
jgi:hypothetical protein